ncbi:MAG TPA: DUF4249 domain-containing protein [Sediminibacterium sp.]|nr:DUF4249 domain-containing protein [Sediminibacterium sp.]
MKQYRFLVFLLLSFLLGGCERDITIVPVEQSPKLVVDAQIEAGSSPIVVLSNSLNYFSSIDTAELYNSFVKNASVSISDGSQTSQLKFYEVRLPGGYRYFYYSNDPADPSGGIIGAIGKTYTLTVVADGKTYTASTKIPIIRRVIDSLWYKPVPNRPANDSFVILTAKITDSPGLGDCIRYFTKVNPAGYLPGYNSVYDDNIIDGKTYSIDLAKGVDKNLPLDRDNAGFFKKGDTISVKFSNIDRNTYNFWRTWEFTYQSIGNPFSNPGVVLGNISNGGLGAFCGYAPIVKGIIIPK